jgi:predicted molibdopterin-dependent oxidoreductase YjgC
MEDKKQTDLRIAEHPILGPAFREARFVTVTVNGKPLRAVEGEPVAAALLAAGIRTFRTTPKLHHPRGIFCAIGRCTDCALTIDGIPNRRTCVTRVREGMRIEIQDGLGKWGGIDD